MDEQEALKVLKGGTKDYILRQIEEKRDLLRPFMKLAIQPDNPLAWRAAWAVSYSMKQNDPVVQPFLPSLTSLIPVKSTSLNRELLKILLQSDLPEDLEGQVFDVCVNFWENTSLQSSVRYYAFKFMVQVMEKHPEFEAEMAYLADPMYLDSLSIGIRQSVTKIIQSTFGQLHK